jgi:hypothetical protein
MSQSGTENLPRVTITAIGSMPHTNAQKATDLIISRLKKAPHIPQLSKGDPREQMWIQCTENLPCFKVDFDNLKYYFDTSGDFMPEVECFYSHYLEIIEGQPADYFKISEEYGKGIHLFRKLIQELPEKPQTIKLQVTGPMSFALTVTDENDRAIFYNDTFKDIAIKGMAMKAAWLIDSFKNMADNLIVFFDEPCLSAYGSSAYMGVSRNDVIAALDDVIEIVQQRGAIPGVHCCGNTDWGLLMDTKTQIINFDAVDYMHTMSLYTDKLNGYLEKNGILAWGAVQNDKRIENEQFNDVTNRIKSGIQDLTKVGVSRDLLTRKILVTPACGCAGLDTYLTEKVYDILSELDKLNPEMFFS